LIYVKSILTGTALLIGCIAVFTFALAQLMHLDARWIMGRYPFISLPMMLAIFVTGVFWQFRRGARREKRGHHPTAR
jgi:hypothetical protein